MNIQSLPSIGGRVLRIFQPKANKTLAQKPNIPLRENLTISGSAQKLGVSVDILASLGITRSGIDPKILRAALHKSIPDGIDVRKEEKRNIENVFRAIIGRLGAEDVVFKPLKLLQSLAKLNDDEKAHLLLAYAKKEFEADGPKLVIFIAKAALQRIAGNFFPD